MSSNLISIYNKLYKALGPQHWWPGETPFEVCLGAILTQNTNWKNVEKAIKNLKDAGVLTPEALHKIPHERLAGLIRPAGYYNIKTKRLKNFISFLMKEYQGDLGLMFDRSWSSLREDLLSVRGVGKETADSILLYAGEKPVFVVDAYTKRIFVRHGIVSEEADYDEIQDYFMSHLPDDVQLFNEYHALIVRTGKDFCKKTPLCEECPLRMDEGKDIRIER